MGDGDLDRRRLVEEALHALEEADADLASLLAIHRQMLADARRLSQLGTQLSQAIAHAEAHAANEKDRLRVQGLNKSYSLLQLQIAQNHDAESRQFSQISNILKTRHDTAKNSISNIR